MIDPSSEPANLTTCIVVLLSVLVFFAKVALLVHHDRTVPLRAARWAKQVLKNALGCNASAGEGRGIGDSELQAQVNKVIRERRVLYASYAIHAGWILGTLRGLEPVARFVSETSVDPDSERMFRYSQTGLLLAATLSVAFPKLLVTSSTLILWHLYGMALLCLSVAPVYPLLGHRIIILQPSLLLLSLTLGMLHLHFATVALSNFCLSACFIAAYAVSPEQVGGTTTMDIARFEISCWVFKLMVLWCAQAIIKFGVLKEVEAQMGRCHRTAVMSLLDMMCDAVVDLDSSLLLKEHYVKLAGLLMRGAGRSLQGSSLSEFIASTEDQDRFREFVAANCAADEGRSAPGMVNVCFRDSASSPVNAIVFHVPYLCVSGAMHHLIGLCEEETSPVPGVSDGDAPGFFHGDARDHVAELHNSRHATGPRGLPAAVLRSDLALRLRDLRGSIQAHAVGSEGAFERSQSAASEEAPNLVADVLVRDRLPLKAATSDLRALLHLHAEGCCFGDALGGSGERLVSWVHTKAAAVKSRSEPSGVFGYGAIRIRRSEPHGASETHTSIYLISASFPPPTEDPGHNYIVSIKLTKAPRQHRRTPGSQRHLRSHSRTLAAAEAGDLSAPTSRRQQLTEL